MGQVPTQTPRGQAPDSSQRDTTEVHEDRASCGCCSYLGSGVTPAGAGPTSSGASTCTSHAPAPPAGARSRTARRAGARGDPPPPEPVAIADRVVDREQVTDAVAALCGRGGDVGITTSLSGARGFGKTKLAEVVSANPKAFPGRGIHHHHRPGRARTGHDRGEGGRGLPLQAARSAQVIARGTSRTRASRCEFLGASLDVLRRSDPQRPDCTNRRRVSPAVRPLPPRPGPSAGSSPRATPSRAVAAGPERRANARAMSRRWPRAPPTRSERHRHRQAAPCTRRVLAPVLLCTRAPIGPTLSATTGLFPCLVAAHQQSSEGRGQ